MNALVLTLRGFTARLIVGIRHGMEVAQLPFISFMHPSLFSNLISIEPQLVDIPSPGNKSASLHRALAAKPDIWTSE